MTRATATVPMPEPTDALEDRDDEALAIDQAADEAAHEAAVDSVQHLRMLEALLFAAAEPLDDDTLKSRLPQGADLAGLLAELQAIYDHRGVNLVRVSGKWAFRTASDLAFLLRKETTEQRRLSRAGIETLAIVAYHQPVTRAEIEEIRGVAVSRGTIDQLLELDWIRLGRRRMTPGRPVTFVVTETFLDHFGLESARDLPGLKELRAAGLLDNRPLPGAQPLPDTDGDEMLGQTELFED